MKKEASDVCLKISEDAVIKIARLSALEINGVSDIGKKAVSVKNLGGVIEIDIEIYITTLEEAQAVAGKIQYAVKDSVQHPLYKKILKRTKKFKVHDENNEAGIGDRVEIMETRKISKQVNWRLVKILEKAK